MVGTVTSVEALEITFPFDIIGEEVVVLGFGLGFVDTFAFGIIIPPPPPPKANFDIDPVGSNAGALLESVDEEATILA